MTRVVESRKLDLPAFDTTLESYLAEIPKEVLIQEAVDRVLHLPSVGSKSFLITIGDRTVTGLITRDQMVGPWQVPVADVAVTATALEEGVKTGESMAMGEKPTLALISPAASAKMAVAESLMNLAASDIRAGSRECACQPTGWRLGTTLERAQRCMKLLKQLVWTSARSWVSVSPSVRTQ